MSHNLFSTWALFHFIFSTKSIVWKGGKQTSLSVRIFWRCRLLEKWHLSDSSLLVLMLMLTSFLDGVKDTFEKKKKCQQPQTTGYANNTLPWLHHEESCKIREGKGAWLLNKSSKQNKTKQEKKNNNKKEGKNDQNLGLFGLPVQPKVHFEMMNQLERKTYSRCSLCLQYLLHHVLSRGVIPWK